VENIKVFELAKQMGLETIALMDKLREFKIPIKSHMADLDEELINQIKVKFEEEKSKVAAKGKAQRRPSLRRSQLRGLLPARGNKI